MESYFADFIQFLQSVQQVSDLEFVPDQIFRYS